VYLTWANPVFLAFFAPKDFLRVYDLLKFLQTIVGAILGAERTEIMPSIVQHELRRHPNRVVHERDGRGEMFIYDLRKGFHFGEGLL